ncbi:hypothetical protein P154DRAFT_482770 [Amniculicola lignicola CBS 123094]|uniref:Uncharacterized protein n=1 Tax=Amniculicola lignicola CBS 123094 TaxID=1392246 RepID=A0A6A5WWC2_9PLEO|nr:hypothetical protein P154DRAFT_482770 [Amniculicola lignicola CBS 123094]
MPHPLTLLIYPSPIFAAHWALFLPSPSSPDQKHGLRIHADGSPLTGFTLVVEEAYDLREETGRWKRIELGDLRVSGSGSVGGGVAEEGQEEEKVRGALRQMASSVPVPGKTLRSVGERGVPERRVTIQNCQTWVREVVLKMIEEGMLGEEALPIVDGAAKK